MTRPTLFLTGIIATALIFAFGIFSLPKTSPALDSGNSGEGGPVVVELFTSQGCSSCPPADKLLGELAKDNDIVALAWHVTYWDRLGWTDPFGLKQATELQYAYSHAMGRGRVYTPQMIIDGTKDVVGSRKREVRATVKQHRNNVKKGKIDLALNGRQLLVSLPEAPTRQNCEVWVVSFLPSQQTNVARGENGGKKLIGYNIVTSAQQVGRWTGSPKQITVDIDRKTDAGGVNHFAVLARDSGPGKICAAGKYTL